MGTYVETTKYVGVHRCHCKSGLYHLDGQYINNCRQESTGEVSNLPTHLVLKLHQQGHENLLLGPQINEE